jgi:SSS family solute:Na+ symporter
MLEMLTIYAPTLLAGLLGAAIMACVMASDSQILALSTMFGEDVFAFYGGRRRYGEKAEVIAARCFVVLVAVVAYAIAIAVHQDANIFEIAIQFAFSGYASMAPIMLGCLFWRRATKWGVLASTLWVAACLVGFGVLQARTAPPASPTAPPLPIWKIGDTVILVREYVRISFTEARVLLVAPMFIGSALLMVVVSLVTRPPSAETLDRYFPRADAAPGTPSE